jgi:hypothetical protein
MLAGQARLDKRDEAELRVPTLTIFKSLRKESAYRLVNWFALFGNYSKRRVDKALAVIHFWCMALRLYTLLNIILLDTLLALQSYLR